MTDLDDDALAPIAAYFGALAVPMRLRILSELRTGERSVGEITSALGCTQANISKHLAVLVQAGLAARSHRGTKAYYRAADETVYELCDLVCGHLDRQYINEAAHRSSLHDVAGRLRREGPISDEL